MRSDSSGTLDVDIRNPSGKIAVENIIYTNLKRMPDGNYNFYVNNFSSALSNGGFSAEIEFDGSIHEFNYPNNLKGRENVSVATVTKKNGVLSFTDVNPLMVTGTSQISEWGISSNTFHKVEMMLLSPNHWDDQAKGNKHYMFMIQNCRNPEATRGLYNEFLRSDLNEHRKVFEVLGSKLLVQPSDDQLSGLGFSSTQRNEVLVRVTGAFNRNLLIQF